MVKKFSFRNRIILTLIMTIKMMIMMRMKKPKQNIVQIQHEIEKVQMVIGGST